MRLRVRGGDQEMKKNVIKILWVLGVYVLIFFCFAPIARAIDGSNLPTDEPEHNRGHLYVFPEHDKGVCDNCHMPHGATGNRIWSDMDKKGPLKGNTVKDLCGSCHYSDVVGFNGIITSGRSSGDNGNVFLLTGEGKETQGANHVMGFDFTGVESDYNTSKAKFNKDVFPFDDEEGFYCGSCHDPHKQPNGKTNGDGDYLRTGEGRLVGEHNNRKDFCRQCHLDDCTGTPEVCVHNGIEPDPTCYDCHRVHDAYKYEDEDNDMQDLIFVDPVEPQPWFQSPPGTCAVDSENKYYESQACIDCHTAPNSDEIWENAPRLPRNRMHHYNGRKWDSTSCKGCHPLSSDTIDDQILNYLDGWVEKDGARLPEEDRVFSCTSCHTAHSEQGYTNFLRFANFKEDATDFCEYCHASCEQTIHSPKTMANLSANNGEHFKTQAQAKALQSPIERTVWNTDPDTGVGAEEEVGCGGCMFCHFIHPKESDMVAKADIRVVSDPATYLRTDLQTLMRIPAVVLDWDEAANENTISNKIDRYEALCNGCHSDEGIVGSAGNKDSSFLDITKFSHRFACIPDTTKNPSQNIPNKNLHRSDGAGTFIMDDYGTTANQIYCGTCHDVHNNSKSPYLSLVLDEDESSPASPYLVDTEADRGKGLCEQCHCLENSLDPMAAGGTHPVGDDKVPSSITAAAWPDEFFGGGSGLDKGITADTTIIAPISGGTDKGGLLCLTCHNIHAATTTWDRKAKIDPDTIDETKDHGPLLVMDNFQKPLDLDSKGSDMCKACHPDF